jgi:hypothetical protein
MIFTCLTQMKVFINESINDNSVLFQNYGESTAKSLKLKKELKDIILLNS